MGQQHATQAIDFELSDQFDKVSKFTFPTGKKIMLVFADRSSSKQTKDWTSQLRKDFPNRVQIVGIAVMGWVPFFIKGSVKDSFTKKPAILMDWNSSVAEEYDYKEDTCLLVYIDEGGVIQWSYKGVFDLSAYDQLKAKLK